MICQIHQKEFKGPNSRNNLWHVTTKDANGNWQYCNVPVNPDTQPTPKAPEPTREKVEPTDWDEIARGKIRSLFIQSHIQRNGLVLLSASDLLTLDTLVEVAMGNK